MKAVFNLCCDQLIVMLQNEHQRQISFFFSSSHMLPILPLRAISKWVDLVIVENCNVFRFVFIQFCTCNEVQQNKELPLHIVRLVNK